VKFRHYFSGSSGNCMTLSDGRTTVLLDAGVSIKEMIRAGVPLEHISAALITHEHSDHIRSARDLCELGLTVYATVGTLHAIDLVHDRVRFVAPGNAYYNGSLEISCFSVFHDAAQPVGYIIESDTGEKSMYCADTSLVKVFPRALTHLVIECNYSQALVDRMQNDWLRQRIKKSHLSIEALCSWLDLVDRSCMQEIHLVHLSNTNADPGLFKKMIQDRFGIPTYTIDDGLY